MSPQVRVLRAALWCSLSIEGVPLRCGLQTWWELLHEVCVVLCSGRGHDTVSLVARGNSVFVAAKRVLKRDLLAFTCLLVLTDAHRQSAQFSSTHATQFSKLQMQDKITGYSFNKLKSIAAPVLIQPIPTVPDAHVMQHSTAAQHMYAYSVSNPCSTPTAAPKHRCWQTQGNAFLCRCQSNLPSVFDLAAQRRDSFESDQIWLQGNWEKHSKAAHAEHLLCARQVQCGMGPVASVVGDNTRQW